MGPKLVFTTSFLHLNQHQQAQQQPQTSAVNINDIIAHLLPTMTTLVTAARSSEMFDTN